MIRLIVMSICILSLIICIGSSPGKCPIKTLTPDTNEGLLLLAAADETDKASGDQSGEKKEDEAPVPGIDRIAASVCYG